MDDDTLRMNRLSLRFVDARVEASFAEEQARKSLRPIRIAFITGAVFLAIASMVTTYFPHLLPGVLNKWYLVIGIGGCVAFYVASPMPFFLRLQQQATLVILCIFSVYAIFFVARLPVEIRETRGYVFLVLHTYSIYSLFRLRFPAAAAAGCLSLGMYLGYLIHMELLTGPGIARHTFVLVAANGLGMVICYQMDLATRREFTAMRQLADERARSERLLLNILPASIAKRLKASDASIADHADEVTVLFADIVGFTPLSARKTPQALLAMLNRIYSEFDSLAETHGLEKIKTIGDAYMAVAGLPDYRADHAHAAARMAQGMLAAIERLSAEMGESLAVRIGLHSGPVVAGVIGRKKFSYDLWGDTVNTASRMESHGIAGMIQCTATTATLLRDQFPLSSRGSPLSKVQNSTASFGRASGADTRASTSSALNARCRIAT